MEQASAITMQATSSQFGGVSVLPVPEKEWFVERVGENGAVVSTAQELRDAINSGKETICVYGAIDLGTITSATALTLKDNQKLVGVGYFGNYDNVIDKFSSITANSVTANVSMININRTGCLVSDLSINYQNNNTDTWIGGIRVNTVEADLNNLDIEVKYSDINGAGKAAVYAYNGAIINVRGNNNLVAFGKYGHGFLLIGGASCNALENSNINIEAFGVNGRGFTLYNSTNCSIGGNLQIYSSNGHGFYNYPGSTSHNTITIQSTAKVYMNTALAPIYNGYKGAPRANVLDIAAGARLAFAKDGNVKWYKLKTDYHDENTSTNKNNEITFDNVESTLNVESTAAWSLPEIIAEMAESINGDLSGYSASYQKILEEYDNLIKDASYQGINLLNGALKEITLNENRSNKYKVEGKDMSSKNIGLSRDKWETLDDVTRAMNELTAAVNSIRSFQEELGNHYSIIQTRINFTEALTDVLKTGADNLTLADMNEASAQYLTLQTRQQLAINSLSLASQSAQSILSIF